MNEAAAAGLSTIIRLQKYLVIDKNYKPGNTKGGSIIVPLTSC